MQAMILAAGLGTRLRPHTLRRPKPLFPVLDRPLLARIIADLRRAGCRRVVVNAFHLRQQLAALLAGAPDLEIQLEDDELGTGGALRLAYPRFSATEPVLVVNGDIFHNIDYRWVMDYHRREGNDATLVLHDRPRFNQVSLGTNGDILSFADLGGTTKPDQTTRAGGSLMAFTGIQVIDPTLLALIPPGRFYNSIDWYRQLIMMGYRVRALTSHDHCWVDIGTPADYLGLHQKLLVGRARELLRDEPTESGLPCPGQTSVGTGSPFFCGKNVQWGRGVELVDWAAIGTSAELGAGVRLRRCVVWDGVKIPAGVSATDTIFSG